MHRHRRLFRLIFAPSSTKQRDRESHDCFNLRSSHLKREWDADFLRGWLWLVRQMDQVNWSRRVDMSLPEVSSPEGAATTDWISSQSSSHYRPSAGFHRPVASSTNEPHDLETSSKNCHRTVVPATHDSNSAFRVCRSKSSSTRSTCDEIRDSGSKSVVSVGASAIKRPYRGVGCEQMVPRRKKSGKSFPFSPIFLPSENDVIGAIRRRTGSLSSLISSSSASCASSNERRRPCDEQRNECKKQTISSSCSTCSPSNGKIHYASHHNLYKLCISRTSIGSIESQASCCTSCSFRPKNPKFVVMKRERALFPLLCHSDSNFVPFLREILQFRSCIVVWSFLSIHFEFYGWWPSISR